MKKSILRIAAFVALAVCVALPGFAARGTADFTRFVAIGDSFGAGLESASLNQNHQPFSWPAVIAKQVGDPLCPVTATATDKCFAQPLVSFPGIGPELQLVNVISYPPTIAPAPGLGSPLVTTFGRPYNNLSVPGATVEDVITLTGKEDPTSTAKTFARFILRGLGTEVQQALAQQPTFIAVWIGGNNALGAVLNGNAQFLDTKENFQAAYNAMLDQLVAGAPNAGMVVGTLPTNVRVAPYATAIAPVIINPATRQPLLVNGQPVPYIYQGPNGPAPIPAGTLIILGAQSLLAQGYGIPPQLAQIPPFNQLPKAGTPLPADAVLTPDEITAIETRIGEFNTIITQAAAARNIPVADISGLFNRVLNRQEFVGPFSLTPDFITGGFFNLDGFHLTDIGYTLFADEFIKAINNAYGTKIPLAPVADLLQNNGANIGFFGTSSDFDFSAEAAHQMQTTFAPGLAPAPRFRAVRH